LVRLKVDIIVVTTTPAALAVKRETTTIPIVFPNAISPVESGVVASLAHPGANVTGGAAAVQRDQCAVRARRPQTICQLTKSTAFDEDEGHIGEEFEVNHEPGQKCTFTMRRRGGPIVESISFDRLSSEYRTSRRDGYTQLVVGGQPGAQCEYVGRSKKCSSSLEMLLLDNGMAPHELDLAARALRYIFSNVCKPAELPF
jgi:ABC transporter substrate binding protein